MNIEKYTERARGFIQSAQTFALGKGSQQFLPVHLLKVLLDDPEGLASGLIERAGGDAKIARAETEAAGLGPRGFLIEAAGPLAGLQLCGDVVQRDAGGGEDHEQVVEQVGRFGSQVVRR